MADKAVVLQRDIEAGLRQVGLKEGDIVGVHSSLSRFGCVEGGAEAVIDALLAVVGKSGSVVMPAYSTNREHLPTTPEDEAMGITTKSRLLPYDPQTEPCWTGKIPETFRRRPEALRGDHPTHSLAAIGPHASRLLQGWRSLLELDGSILLLGVTLAVCSAMHLAEENVELPGYIAGKSLPLAEAQQKYPPGEWCIGGGPYPDFGLMEGPCQERGILKITRTGDAVVKLVRLRELIDLYAEYLRNCPEAFYHGCVPAA
jgi:aminoglycoside 3-N-acetyltransferase